MGFMPNKKGMAKGRMTLNYRGDSKETNFARRKKVCMPCILPDDWKWGLAPLQARSFALGATIPQPLSR